MTSLLLIELSTFVFIDKISTSSPTSNLILFFDFLWVLGAFSFAAKRKHFRTDPKLDYLHVNKIPSPAFSVVIPTYNEESAISEVVSGFLNHKNVQNVIVVDNNSSDKTVEIAKKSGAIVITKNENKGYSHSLVLGLKEALKTNSNIIGATEADGTYNSYDIQKMIYFLNTIQEKAQKK